MNGTVSKHRIRIAAVIAAIVSGAIAAAAQHNHGTQQYGPAPTFTDLPSPTLMTGIGTASIKITTRSAETRRFFDQGLNLLHAFWDMEAYRAFREAARLDPNCAMAYWGIYNALGQNSQEMADERFAALKKAVELSASASDHEQYYIRAISLLAETGKGRPAWIGEMEALINKYPDDVEAKLLLANSLSSPASSYLPDGRPREGKMYGQSILKNLMVSHPDNAAVHHYWIHAVENGPRPQEALKSAEKLVRLAPNSGHMLHMPGHIYYRLGMYEKARTAFVASLEFDLRYMRENKVHPINNWNYTHNLDYLVAALAEEGRYAEAAKYAVMLRDIPADDTRLKSTGLGYMLYGGKTALIRLQMRFGMWETAVAELERSQGPADSPLAAMYRAGLLSYLKGMSALGKGDVDGAATQMRDLRKTSDEMAGIRGQNASDWYSAHAARVLAVHALDLGGSLASLSGEHTEAVRLLTDAVEREKNLGYWEPPHYTRPVLESLGFAYARAGKIEEARMAFERELEIRPRSGFAYLGIAEIYDKAGDAGRAAWARKQLAEAWAGADKDLPRIKNNSR